MQPQIFLEVYNKNRPIIRLDSLLGNTPNELIDKTELQKKELKKELQR